MFAWMSEPGWYCAPIFRGPRKRHCPQTLSVAGEASARPQPRWRSGEAESLRGSWTSCSPSAPHPGALASPLPPGTPQGAVTVYLEMAQCPSLEARPESGRGHRENRTNTDGAKVHPPRPTHTRNPFPVEQPSYREAEKTRQPAFLRERGLGLWEGRERAGTGPPWDGPHTDSPAGPQAGLGGAGGCSQSPSAIARA